MPVSLNADLAVKIAINHQPAIEMINTGLMTDRQTDAHTHTHTHTLAPGLNGGIANV